MSEKERNIGLQYESDPLQPTGFGNWKNKLIRSKVSLIATEITKKYYQYFCYNVKLVLL